jgi:hypothetical protein
VESTKLHAQVGNPSDELVIQVVEATLEALESAELGKQRILMDRGPVARAAVVMSVVKSVSDLDSRCKCCGAVDHAVQDCRLVDKHENNREFYYFDKVKMSKLLATNALLYEDICRSALKYGCWRADIRPENAARMVAFKNNCVFISSQNNRTQRETFDRDRGRQQQQASGRDSYTRSASPGHYSQYQQRSGQQQQQLSGQQQQQLPRQQGMGRGRSAVAPAWAQGGSSGLLFGSSSRVEDVTDN